MAGLKGYVAVIGEAIRNLFRPNVTNMFPFEPATPLPEGFRGAPEVNPETCILCRTCERECPSHCIKITGPVDDPNTPEGMEAYKFSITLAQCMFCQTCEEVCPVGRKGTSAIVLTDRYLLANYSVEATVETKIVYKKAKKKKES